MYVIRVDKFLRGSNIPLYMYENPGGALLATDRINEASLFFSMVDVYKIISRIRSTAVKEALEIIDATHIIRTECIKLNRMKLVNRLL